MSDQLRCEVDEVGSDRHVLLVRPLLDVGRGAAGLARGLEIAALELRERALREHGEARDPLDLVAEQLDAHGLGARRREDVEDVAAHGQLAAIADALDARVAGRNERGDGVVAHELSPALDVQRRRAPLGRRHALDQRSRGDSHQTAGAQQPEAARALADEVRRRLEARAVRDAARRHESDLLGRRVPGRLVGDLAGALVVVAEDGEARAGLAPPALPERCQERREQRLGTARTRGQRGVECARELGDAGLRGDLVRDGRKVGEADVDGAIHVRVHAFGRHAAGARRIASGS